MSLPVLDLSGLELRRFTRAKLTRIALAGIVMVPLLYAGLYLWSFWDPNGRFKHLPVALVVLDRPVEAGGRTLAAGHALAEGLRDRGNFDWRLTDPASARQGVADGTYYFSLTIPPDFSARIASPGGAAAVRPADLRVQTNDSNNYIVGTIAAAAFAEVRSTAAADATTSYFNDVFVSFATLHGSLSEATEGAGKLAAGADKAGAGARTLAGALGDAHTGSGRLATGAKALQGGLATARTGSGRLASGADTLHDGLGTASDGGRRLADGLAELGRGSKSLAEGSGRVAAGLNALTATAHSHGDELVPFLATHVTEIRLAAKAVAATADAVASAAGELPALTARAADDARRARADLERFLADHPELPATVTGRWRATADEIVDVADRLHAYAADHAGDLERIGEQAAVIGAKARELDRTAPGLAARLKDALLDLDRLNAGGRSVAAGARSLDGGLGRAGAAARKLADGLARLDTGAGTLAVGADGLDGGLGRLSGGAGRLTTGQNALTGGLYRLEGGAGSLTEGLDGLSRGSSTLAGGLADGVRRVPLYGDRERADRAAMMASPVRLTTDRTDAVSNYGTGFAPFFVPLSLWVGAMITYLILKPLNPRALAGNAPPWRIALAGWLPAALVGAGQAVTVLLVLRLALGLHAVHWIGLILLLCLGAAAFAAVIQWANARFGTVGKAVALVLLMLQLTSAAGTYPIETSPRFFQVIQNWLPMPWLVRATRRLVSGGELAVVWQASLVLTAFVLAFLALTMLATRSARTWSVAKLHPALKI